MIKSLTPVNPVPVGTSNKTERRSYVALALLALSCLLPSYAPANSAEACSELFKRQTIELKDPSAFACIKSKFGCKPKSVTIPVLNGKLSPAQFRIFFEDRKEHFWKLHQRIGIKEILVVDSKSDNDTPRLLEDSEGEELQLRSRQIDEEALRRSAIDIEPVENAIFIFYDQSGTEISRTEWIKGQKESVDALELYEPLKTRLREINVPISRIELIHSHPVHEIIIKTASEDEPSLYVRHTLSRSDFQVAESISRLMPNEIPFVITAVVPSGRRYTAVFVNGSNESRGWLKRASELQSGIRD